jgi:general secretion pathway protein D
LEVAEVGGISIKINPPLTDVRLADVLDAIVKVADTPIKYSVEEYAVVFSLKGQDVAPLYTRTFRVDPNTFYQGLESVGAISFGDVQTGGGGGAGGGGGGGGGRGGGGGGGGQGGQGSFLTIPRVDVSGLGGQGGQGGQGGGQVAQGPGIGGGQAGAGGAGAAGGTGLRFITRSISVDEVQAAVRFFFTAAGVDLAPPKSIFFNDRQGTLLVRGTLQDLDIIESAIQALNIAPPQINIRAQFAQIAQTDAKALGFDWYLGNILFNDGKIVASGGSQPTMQGTPGAVPGNPAGPFPGNPNFGTDIPPSITDGWITSGLRDPLGSPALASVTGILTDPQFRVVIKALEQHAGTDLLTAPEVTTLSGRQAQIQVVDIITIVTGTTADQTATGATTGAGTGGNVVQNTGNVIQPTTQPLPFGPTLDVIPYVSADGCTIQMTIIPTVTEFLGYDDPGEFVVSATTAAGVTTTAVLPLPHFRVRQVTTSCILWDGQTVVLGGLITEDVSKLKDKVPLLGNIPVLGKLFRSEATSSFKRNLVIFVTPTIIDPAGNRVNRDEEMPFAQSTIPVQPPVVNQ